MNKVGCSSSAAVFHLPESPPTGPVYLSFGAQPQSYGVATWRASCKHLPPLSRRDSSHPCLSRYYFYAAFSCGVVSILDSWRLTLTVARSMSSFVHDAMF